MPIADSAENLGLLLVDGFAVVVERGRLQNDGCRANEDSQSKYPEEETIQHHRHVLPILANLQPSTQHRTKKEK